MKLSVVMPVYNELKTLAEILRRVTAVDIQKEIIIVDDCSTDGSREFLKKFVEEYKNASDRKNEIKLLLHEKNMGKTSALNTGFQHISGDIVIVQDADLEYNPQEYHILIKPIVDGLADVVYGSRFLGGPHRVLFFWHFVGNKILTTFSNMFTNLNLSDMETGYKAFRADVIKRINLKSKRFGFEPEVTSKVAKLGCKIYEVPISYSGRTYAEGKKINWKDGVRALYQIIRYSLFD